MLHGRLALCQWHTSATLGIRHQQRPCLVDAIAPLGDIVAVQTTAGLIGTVCLYQLTLATHGLLTILPRMVEIRYVDTDTDGTTRQTRSRSLYEMLVLFLEQSFYTESDDHRQHNEQVVVGHLYVVGQHLQGCEERREQHTPQVFASVCQYHTGNHRRQVGQRHHLPDMTSGNNDEKVATECPYHSTQSCQIDTEVKGTQQDIEAQQVHEDIPHILGQS